MNIGRLGLLVIFGFLSLAPASAQQPPKQHRIAIVTSVIPAFLIREDSGDDASRLLFTELRRLGHAEGADLVIERYSAEGHPERLPALAGEVVARAPECQGRARSPPIRSWRTPAASWASRST